MSKKCFIKNPKDFFDIIQPRKTLNCITYPINIKNKKIKYKHSSNHNWFKYIVDNILNKKIEQALLEDNIFLLMIARFNAKYELEYLNLQTLISVEGEIKEFYNNSRIKTLYLRLDYELGKLGNMFSHPMPHIELSSKDIRFPFTNSSSNIIVDFIEFLYLNFHYEKWEKWAKRVINKAQIFGTNSYEQVAEFFKQGAVQKLLEYEDFINKMKEILIEEKRKLSKLILPEYCKIINYV